MRMERTALYAIDNGFRYFTTTNATSRWKDVKQVNESGMRGKGREGKEIVPFSVPLCSLLWCIVWCGVVLFCLVLYCGILCCVVLCCVVSCCVVPCCVL